MSLNQFPPKDPDAYLDYTSDWTAWLTPASDTIVSATWSVNPSGGPEDLVLSNQSILSGMKAVTWIAGGKVGRTYQVTVEITTAAGRIDDRTYDLTVEER